MNNKPPKALSPKEREILTIMKKSRRKQWTAEAMADALYDRKEGSLPRPKNWVNATTVSLRRLSEKTICQTQKVVKVSTIGRGIKAIYQLEGGTQ